MKYLENYVNIQWMVRIIQIKECIAKYQKNKYRDILLSTGDKILHENPMRGNGDDWTYPGKDLLGILLMEIRYEIIHQ